MKVDGRRSPGPPERAGKQGGERIPARSGLLAGAGSCHGVAMDHEAALLAELRRTLAAIDDGRIADFIGDDWPAGARRTVRAAAIPALRHLGPAAAIAEARPLAELLAGSADHLAWGRTYSEADLGVDFVDNYGWTELAGQRGPFVSSTLAIGLLLIGPARHYPAHRHEAAEIYVPLTGGTEWRRGAVPFAPQPAGAVIEHPSGMVHAMRTGSQPLLAAYLWRGGDLAEKSTLVG